MTSSTCLKTVLFLAASYIDPRGQSLGVNSPYENSAKLQIAISVDRKICFPGEIATFTITVVNPTASAMKTFMPSRARIYTSAVISWARPTWIVGRASHRATPPRWSTQARKFQDI